MTLEQIETILGKNKHRLDAFGVKSLRLFGSFARGEDRQDSDVDVLVEFEGPATFSGYMGLSDFLEDVLGRKVDLVTTKALREPIRDEILREAKRVA
ncbi:MAG: nucleotidyltransferase family protein [Armatimonadetes bacterium]|nr:nucleotidyltransferase family protein [Armatimonadota bacterium]